MLVTGKTSGCDWITLTNVVQPGSTTLSDVFEEVSFIPNSWGGGGYKGYSCDVTGIRYGSRSRGRGITRKEEILIASGENSFLVSDADGITNFRCTRLDLQATVIYNDPYENLAVDHYNRLRELRGEGQCPTKRRLTIIRSDTGDTLYLGSRKTRTKLYRVYDKSKWLSLEKGMAWRTETQYNRELAQAALEFYREGAKATLEWALEDLYQESGIALVPEEQLGINLDTTLLPDKDESTIDARLRWLEECVKPVIEKCRPYHLQGDIGPVIKKLGISWDECLQFVMSEGE